MTTASLESNDLRSDSRFFGWRMLAVAVFVSVLTGPGQTIGVSVFIDHFVQDLQISREAVSVAYMVGTLTGALAMPSFGRLIDRRGVRFAQSVIGIGFALALVNMSFVSNLIWLAVGFAGIRMLGQGALSMIPGVSVALWFDRQRGLAMGLLATLASIGLALMPVALNAVIEATSPSTAWLIAAGVVLATVVPLARFVLIDRPSDVGQWPDGRPPERAVTDSVSRDASTTDSASVDDGSLDRAEAIRTREFWILVAVATSVSMLITGLNFHQIDLLGEAGLSPGCRRADVFYPKWGVPLWLGLDLVD